jgi:hypothetical protein
LLNILLNILWIMTCDFQVFLLETWFMS